MKNFEENYCRLCREVLCCVKCRLDHEIHIHNVNPDCEICIYGRVELKTLPYNLLEHIQLQHWPLHCLKCKRLFESLDHLTAHSKCPGGPPVNVCTCIKPAGILAMSGENRYDSPPLADFHKNLLNLNTATSTPTLKIELDKAPMKVTPAVDTGKLHLPTVGSTPNDSAKNEQSKRRATFCETPILEYSSASIAVEKGPGKVRSKSCIATVHKTTANQKNLPDKSLGISVSPLINNDTVERDSPEIGADSHKSIIAGSNKYFFGKQKNIEAVTSTPRIGKQNDERKENVDVEIRTETENKLITNNVKTPDVISETPNVETDALCNIGNKEETEKCPASFQTPIMSTSIKQKQLLTATKQFTGEKTTSQFYSLSTLKLTPSIDIINIPPKIPEENENLHNELVDNNYMKANIQIEETLWMSAINNLNCSEDEDDAHDRDVSLKAGKQGEILSVCLKKVTQVPQNAIAISTEMDSEVVSKISIPKSNLWTSMTQAFNSVVTGLSLLNKSGFVGEQVPSSTKRSWVDEAEDESGPDIKRLKITDIKCRRTIRPICPLSHSVFKVMVDKATQTD